MEKMVRPFEGKQIVDIETESLMVLMKLKINISEAVQQFWQEMQEKYAKKGLSFSQSFSFLAKNSLVKKLSAREPSLIAFLASLIENQSQSSIS